MQLDVDLERVPARRRADAGARADPPRPRAWSGADLDQGRRRLQRLRRQQGAKARVAARRRPPPRQAHDPHRAARWAPTTAWPRRCSRRRLGMRTVLVLVPQPETASTFAASSSCSAEVARSSTFRGGVLARLRACRLADGQARLARRSTFPTSCAPGDPCRWAASATSRRRSSSPIRSRPASCRSPRTSSSRSAAAAPPPGSCAGLKLAGLRLAPRLRARQRPGSGRRRHRRPARSPHPAPAAQAWRGASPRSEIAAGEVEVERGWLGRATGTRRLRPDRATELLGRAREHRDPGARLHGEGGGGAARAQPARRLRPGPGALLAHVQPQPTAGRITHLASSRSG